MVSMKWGAFRTGRQNMLTGPYTVSAAIQELIHRHLRFWPMGGNSYSHGDKWPKVFLGNSAAIKLPLYNNSIKTKNIRAALNGVKIQKNNN